MYSKTYQGTYKLKKPGKYEGDPDKVTYRSSWERACFVWCERNADVVSWSSEETIIPYTDAATKKDRRYFVDLKITFKSGATMLVEIKPNKQTSPPKQPKRKTIRFVEESVTFVTNTCKWEAAKKFAKEKGWTFAVWDENVLRAMGILKV